MLLSILNVLDELKMSCSKWFVTKSVPLWVRHVSSLYNETAQYDEFHNTYDIVFVSSLYNETAKYDEFHNAWHMISCLFLTKMDVNRCD